MSSDSVITGMDVLACIHAHSLQNCAACLRMIGTTAPINSRFDNRSGTLKSGVCVFFFVNGRFVYKNNIVSHVKLTILVTDQ